MTGSIHPIVPQDFSIQVAENEGMPSRSISMGFSPPPALTGRLTGTLTIGLLETHAAAGGLWSAKEQAAMRNPLARLIARTAVTAGMIAFFAMPVFGQDGTGPMPLNARSRSFGGGWVCDLGYRVEGAECLALEIPEHAYPNGRTYGTGWACGRGYEEVSGKFCNPIPMPANAFLRSYGNDWQCERGYRRDRGACLAIVLPENAYLTEDSSESGWTCDRGYLAVAGACMPIAVPANAYLDPASYGPGWSCDRGYKPLSGACVSIELPENAYLDRSGNRWSCNRSFRLSDGMCILGR